MNTPTPKVITEVIDKLSGLQEELRRIQDVANYGEDPEVAKQEAEKAEDCLRRLLHNPPAKRKWTAKELEDLHTRVLGKNAQLPSHLDMYLAVLEGLSAVLRSLPIYHLKALKSMMALRTALRDEEEIAAGFTIGALKSMTAVVLVAKEMAMARDVQDARARVYRDIEEILHPYEEFLTASRQGADKSVVSLTASILSADVEQLDWVIHPFKKIRRKLDVEADQRKTEQKPNREGQPNAAMAGRTTHVDIDAFVVSAIAATRTKSFVEWAGDERVTLAIVFTDIVSSTALCNEIGDERMGTVRNAHFDQGRKLLSAHKGREVKTIGDSIMAAFHSVDQALDFAMAFQSDPGHPRIRIRAGIHVGALQVEGSDVFGGTVNFAARVVGAIQGPEIWLSERAKGDIDGLRASRHAHLKWECHNGVTMKGFSVAATLWSVV